MKNFLIFYIIFFSLLNFIFVKKGCTVEYGSLSGKIDFLNIVKPKDIVVFIDFNFKKEIFSSKNSPEMGQVGMKFDPFVLPVIVGTTVHFHNSAGIFHNVYSPSKAAIDIFNNGTLDLGIYGMEEDRDVTFVNPGVVLLLCNIHQNMEAYILVLKSPFFTSPDEKGLFEINNIPPGNYMVRVWSKNFQKSITNVKITNSKVTNIEVDLR